MKAAAPALALALFASACGGSAPPPAEAAPPAATATEPGPPKQAMHLEGQLGSMDPREFDAAFNTVLTDLQRCHTQRLEHIRWLSGDVKIFLRVGEDGTARYGYFEDTTLGDRDTESCMMQALLSAHWPKPIGGEAEVRKSIGFDAPSDVRAPVAWSSDEITPALVAANAKIRACRGRVAGSFKATAYVVPAPPGKAPPPPPKRKGSKAGRAAPKRGKSEPAKAHGRILSVGIAPPSAEALESIDCLVDALKQMPVPSPGSYAAKVSFSL